MLRAARAISACTPSLKSGLQRGMTSTATAPAAGAGAARVPLAILSVGSVLGRTALPADALIKAAPRGAYTTARTHGRHAVFEFETHVRRTAASAALMMAEEAAAGADAAAAAAAAYGEITDPGRLRPVIMSALSRAVAAFDAAAVDAVAAAAGSESDAQAQARHLAECELKLTLLLTWGRERSGAAYAAAAGALTDAAAANAARAAAAGAASGAGSDASTAPLPPQWALLTHVAPLPPRRAPPVRVLLAGAPRHNAAAKDSSWVVARQGLEAARNVAGAEEVVLTTTGSELAAAAESGGNNSFFWAAWDVPLTAAAAAPADGRTRRAVPRLPDGGTFLLEGTQTNFFALSADGRSLLTAPEGAVLSGTVRRLVVHEVADALGLYVKEAPPTLDGALSGGWSGAFLTSTSRLVLPVDELLLPAASASGSAAGGSSPPQHTVLPLGSRGSAVLAALEAAVAGAIAAHSTRLEL